MPEDIQELQEYAEESGHNASLRPVTLTMTILALLVAAVGLLGHRSHTEELLLQNRSSDRWSYYQAQNTRMHTYELFLDFIAISDPRNPELAQKTRKKYSGEIERYQEKKKEIEAEARKMETEMAVERKKADRFDLGEVLLEVSLVSSSITLLAKQRLFWKLGLILGVLGVGIAATGLLIR